ncbi:hypothetical protein GMES_2414 [Paraglaciecola mesophila KMM 241]|uniref:Uncharacterized protein n=1 Tax=Paraglaciecola mesophila KMM 241 TaxID=1128912 RepID=K6XVR7_9ALTE|nr:hypothetical protein GMES_2414 [Paraglaciecola mesophila KMM 241]
MVASSKSMQSPEGAFLLLMSLAFLLSVGMYGQIIVLSVSAI